MWVEKSFSVIREEVPCRSSRVSQSVGDRFPDAREEFPNQSVERSFSISREGSCREDFFSQSGRGSRSMGKHFSVRRNVTDQSFPVNREEVSFGLLRVFYSQSGRGVQSVEESFPVSRETFPYQSGKLSQSGRVSLSVEKSFPVSREEVPCWSRTVFESVGKRLPVGQGKLKI